MSAATKLERAFFRMINETRESRGLAPLLLETHLNAAADAHVRWMLTTDSFSHSGAQGSNARERIERAGFDLAGTWATAENIAYVSVDDDGSLRDEVRHLHQNLMNSPGHRQNILSDVFEFLGIGLQVGWFRMDGREHKVVMAAQNFAATDGNYEIDIAPGITISTAAAPGTTVAGPASRDWEPEVVGEIMRAEGGEEALLGTGGGDDMRGSDSADLMRGRAGDDWIEGGSGDDTLRGDGGQDFLAGQRGHDLIVGGRGSDRASGGQGADRISGGTGHDSLRGNVGHDMLWGDAGNDRLSGDDGADSLFGGGGNDLLVGGGGRDLLNGGAGADILVGGRGNDTLRGGEGADSFVFRRGDGVDRIYGYEPGRDRILIEESLLGPDVAGFAARHIRETSFGVQIEIGENQTVHVSGPSLSAAQVIDDIFLI